MLKVDRLAIAGLPPLSFDVAAGDCIAIEGPSGSGKTRILRAIADLDAAGGYVSLEGAERTELPAPVWRQRARYVSAEPAWWADTARAHVTRAPDRHRFERMAGSLGLAPCLLDAPIARLSTGDRLRLGLARALADEPRLILLDEPTGALDATATALTEELIRFQLLARRAVILVSHDRAQIDRLAQRSLLLGAAMATAAQPAGADVTRAPAAATADERVATLARRWGTQP